MKVALITGAAKRIGAVITKFLHQSGYNVIIHYRHSATEADTLCQTLNSERPDSAITISTDLSDMDSLPNLIEQASSKWNALHVLINNASDFYPTPLAQATQTQWDELMASNLRAPFFLSQAATPHLQKTRGCIINITDIFVQKPLVNYSIYCIAKSGLVTQTQILAKELAPQIRVNAIAPGTILWPSNVDNEVTKQLRIQQTPLRRMGEPHHIANTILFLINNDFITGHILNVDGGRSLT